MVERQIKYMNTLNMSDCEVICVDDGSPTPIEPQTEMQFEHTWIRLENPLKWRLGIPTNRGAEFAKGDFYLMHDIDQFISNGMLNYIRVKDTPHLTVFDRRYALIDAQGRLKLFDDYITSAHVDLVSARHFWALGGYSEDSLSDDMDFINKYKKVYKVVERVQASVKRRKKQTERIVKYCLPEKGDARRPVELLHKVPSETPLMAAREAHA
jgi:hypothetical protein